MTVVPHLPALNAVLNTTSGLLLTAGYLFIRRGRVRAHRACMLAAFTVSTLFLISYVTYHLAAGSTAYQGKGILRTVYFTILISHTILAALVPPLAVTTVALALRNHVQRHRRIARWTLPIWWYVSATGVVVYWMLYRS
ncbi:MAG: DUF420 domain-containing protein [Acidobacteriota bacterium]